MLGLVGAQTKIAELILFIQVNLRSPELRRVTLQNECGWKSASGTEKLLVLGWFQVYGNTEV